MKTAKTFHNPLTPDEFLIFKDLLGRFINTNFNSICSTFNDNLSNADDEKKLKKLFVEVRDDVYEELGGTVVDKYDILDLEYKIQNLEREIYILESELEEVETQFTPTLDDEYRLQFFNEYQKEYSPWELEHILKNGRQFLHENPLYIRHT